MEDRLERVSDTDVHELNSEDLEGFIDEEPLGGTKFRMLRSSAHVGPKYSFEGPVIITGNSEHAGGNRELRRSLLSILGDMQQVQHHINEDGSASQTSDAQPAAACYGDSFNGPVTTMRNLLKFTRCPTLKLQLNKKEAKIVLIIAIIIAIVFTSLIVVLASGNNKTDSESDYIEGLSKKLQSTCKLTLVPRSKWKAAPSNCSPLIKRVYKYHLAKKVALYDTETPLCRVENRCITSVKALQKSHQTQGYCDIFYNFLIAKGGYVYEGEGMSHQENFLANFTAKDLVLNIGLIGTFPERRPADLEGAADCLIGVARELGFLDVLATTIRN